MMDLHHQSHFSAFSRFSDMLKDTTAGRRKPSTSGHSIRQSSVTALTLDPTNMITRSSHRDRDPEPVREHRRSSVGNYADRMRQLFHTSSSSHHHPPKHCINHLPAEVLQNIFVYLEFWDLVRCQRVCKTWQAMVPGDSPLLAETLYLKPSRSLQIYSLVPTTFDFEIDVAPQSSDSSPQHSPGSSISSRFSFGSGDGAATIRNDISLSRRCLGLIRTSQEIVFHPLITDFNFWVNCERVTGKYEGSWRHMLVSMPPLKELTLIDSRQKGAVKVISVSGEEGVKLGQLFDVMDDWKQRQL